jgi:hypothetical protein
MEHKQFELQSEQPSFEDLQREYLGQHTQPDRKIRLLSMMISAAANVGDLNATKELVRGAGGNAVLEGRIETRILEIKNGIESATNEAA